MIDTVLFDLDGTIVDTNELIISSFMHVLEKHGLAPLTREEMIPKMGATLEQQLRHFSGLGDITALHKTYRSYNDEHHDAMVELFPHVEEVVRELHGKGIRLGVVTTKNKPGTIRVLDMFGLQKYMDAVITLNDVEHPKPHPEPVLKAVQLLGSDPARTLMVGDSPMDIQSAKAAGVLAAGVAWSLKGEKTLLEYKPDYILKDMHDLFSLVEQE
ncbi:MULTISPECIES: pyrophosphatase PpaX [Paenibacillus]|uniref:Pyrophosphatase PpaX n=1 Tax=Paenibacillus albilobatus TaxID=2716884 RepID=A0A920CDF1_9BACL|nr:MULTISPECIES: pyrophosphatase PpaX [Paenibacillus]GIO32757.1 pyrophosphatase PpaX [Paenibacillus albilobatus]